MKSWEFFAAATALIAGLWSQVKTAFHWVAGFLISTKWADTSAANVVVAYLAANGSRTTREPAYSMGKHFVKPLKKRHWIAWENLLASGGLLWCNKRPIWMEKQKDGKGFDEEFGYTFKFVRGTLDWEDLLIQAAESRSAVKEGGYYEKRFRVYHHHGKTLGGEIARERSQNQRSPSSGDSDYYNFRWDSDLSQRLLFWRPGDIGEDSRASFDALALTPELLALVDEIRFWERSKDWYSLRGITWRRGYLFHGEPGTGKTSVVRAAAEELNLPVHIFDLATMSNEDLQEAWVKMAKDAPCVALMEDIDGVFHGRKNIAPQGGMMSSGGLTFNELLNTIDGIERTDGVLLVITTNYKKHVDPALNRPGRIDREVEFGPLNYEARLKVARMILGEDDAVKTAMDSPDVPGAVFVEACCRRALQELYSKGPTTEPYR